jgi:la-related protein 1
MPVNSGVVENGVNVPSYDSLAVAPVEQVNGNQVVPSYQGQDMPKAVLNGEADSFSNEQVEALSVIVRKPELSNQASPPAAASRAFSNGSNDARSGIPEESSKLEKGLSSPQVNGTGPSQG